MYAVSINFLCKLYIVVYNKRNTVSLANRLYLKGNILEMLIVCILLAKLKYRDSAVYRLFDLRQNILTPFGQ